MWFFSLNLFPKCSRNLLGTHSQNWIYSIFLLFFSLNPFHIDRDWNLWYLVHCALYSLISMALCFVCCVSESFCENAIICKLNLFHSKRYHEQHLAMNVGSVLQEMAKRQELAPMLLNEIRLTRRKRRSVAQQNDESKEVDDSSFVANHLWIHCLSIEIAIW